MVFEGGSAFEFFVQLKRREVKGFDGHFVLYFRGLREGIVGCKEGNIFIERDLEVAMP